MDFANDYFLRPIAERPEKNRVRRRGRYPHFDLSHVQQCVEALEGAAWGADERVEYSRRLKRYNLLMAWPAGLTLTGLVIGYFLLRSESTYAEVNRLADILRQYADRIPVPVQAAALLLGAVGWARMLYNPWGIRPRARFFRSIERALYIGLTKTHPQAPVAAFNFVGQAARCLFSDIRRGRARTAPPAVSDWAETVAVNLIHVRLMRADGTGDRSVPLEAYWRFIYDAAALVAVRREGLVPVLREAYEELLPNPDDDDFIDRNILFLNPLREHQKWVFVKDFVYPLAAWLSLLVSVAALVLAMLKPV